MGYVKKENGMTSVYLKIDNCNECPHVGNTVCNKGNRPLPCHVVVMPNRFGGGVTTFYGDSGPPEWCPLRATPIKQPMGTKMKSKITKIKNVKTIRERMAGIAVWRITGPSTRTGGRVTVQFIGTRAQAEQVELN